MKTGGQQSGAVMAKIMALVSGAKEEE